MANVKITDLASGTTLIGTELFEAVQSAGSVKLSSTQIKTYTSEDPTFVISDAATNTPSTAAALQHTSSGTVTAGIGTRLDFECQTASGNVEIGARIQAVATDVTAASEDFDLAVLLMAGGSTTQVANFTSTGNLVLTGREVVIPTERTIANAGDPGVKGTICWDASYIYVCVATDTWKRVAIATWP